MSFATITAAQRVAVRDTALQVSAITQPFAQNARTPTAAETALITSVLDKAAAALAVAGASGIPATSAVVANGATVVVQNSAGTAVPGTHTATVAASALSNVKLAATVAAVANGAKVNAVSVTGTGNFATFTIAAGVITAIVLSAS